ncbi:ATP-dependent helicase HepA [Streptomonospora nanhaiensis]|uniref:ATP-dependent helicase HepA n=1 Tax=Streptomonospora nanhaiensis TaxID=1323731 RepID=A0A853BQZ9_9ACTN|nr:protein DpdE [Streptomonospora nanhaiensis]NYI97116.1 ATP-dependent helicase HepA [Streptomonospora nanhaiensis]
MSPRYEIGHMVAYSDSPGVGRIGVIDGARVRVDFFESTAEPVARSEWIAASDCRRVRLERETRVYWRNPDTGVWMAGRVMGASGDDRYFIRFPNAEYDLPVAEGQLRIRWDLPVRDPVTVLAAGGSESAFQDARMGLLRNLIAQRCASASTFALLSSAVELYPHQVHAALTVLSDPVQRYLLADEVGLGKTIEAGFVIRQTLIDNRNAHIAVLAPEMLRRQWIGELLDRFFISDFPAAKVKVVAHEDPERWTSHHGCDLLVVDEAHRLVQDSGPEESPYRELTALAHSAERLLLLSATPVTSHYTTHLGLLHLLDPVLYDWNDRESFQHRYELRERLADSVYGLDSDFTPLLPSSIADIREQLPAEDRRFDELSSAVLDLLDEDDELKSGVAPTELTARIQAVRGHLSEAYRLHRRVIRHRRDTVLRDDPDSDIAPYEVRGRQAPAPLRVDTPVHEATEVAVSEWQSAVWDYLLDTGGTEDAPAYAMVLAVLASRCGVVAGDLLGALRWRVRGDPDGARSAGLSSREQAALAKAPVLTVEDAVLDSLEARLTDEGGTAAGIDGLIRAIVPVLRGKRAVVFCGPGTLAVELAARMRARFPKVRIGEHTHRVGADEAERAVSAWRSPEVKTAVLIADDSAEDGLNLQTADTVVHARLPWSPNQLEQRLGRIDRYRGMETIHASAPADQYRIAGVDADTLTEAWAELLENGYGLFTESVSTLQDAIAEGLPRTWRLALEQSVDGLAESVGTVRAELAAARAAIDKMDMLESIHSTVSETHDVALALNEFETRWRETREALLHYTSGMGGIELRAEERQVQGRRRDVFDITGSQPLLDPRLWGRERQRIRPESAQGVFNRSAALRTPGTRILRHGNPLVDALGSLLRIDDRGQAAAFRRLDRSFAGAPVPYFGFDFLVEADIGGALKLDTGSFDASTELRRQADRVLPPFMLRVWIPSGSDMPVTDPQLNAWLGRPYDKKSGDRNYNLQRIKGLIDIFGGWDRYQGAARAAERICRERLTEVTDLERKCAQAQERARERNAVIRAQALARHAAGHLVSDSESLLLNVDVTEALIEGLSEPTVRVVAASCIVRSGFERVRSGI